MSTLIEVQGLKELQAALKKLPPLAADMGTDKANEYMINVLRSYPPPRRVTYREAYGGWKSDKQRRYFFWALRNGMIRVPYLRTQTLSGGWAIAGSGARSFIYNETPYVGWVMGDGQARMMQLIGWKKADDILEERKDRVTEKFNAGVKKAIKQLGLQGG